MGSDKPPPTALERCPQSSQAGDAELPSFKQWADARGPGLGAAWPGIMERLTSPLAPDSWHLGTSFSSPPQESKYNGLGEERRLYLGRSQNRPLQGSRKDLWCPPQIKGPS